MNLQRVKLSPEIVKTLNAVYQEAKKQNPCLNESVFFEGLISDWLETFKRNRKRKTLLSKDNAVLRNNLKLAIKLCNKSQLRVADEIGINRPYLSQIISGKYIPSVILALLLLEAVEYPPEKFTDVFFLELAD